jgi:hypothetical protein
MPRLTPAELQAARRRSGRLGGRPRKPTQAEARAAALEELVPAAVKSLRAHLGDGDPASWRAALRVFELAYGRADEFETVELPRDPDAIARMSWRELNVLAARFLAELPPSEPDATTGNGMVVTITNDDASAGIASHNSNT